MKDERLGPYHLDRELGTGGMGKVWAATVVGRTPVLSEGTLVALKIVHPHLLESPGFFKRFLREAEIGKAVVHENVVRTYDADAVASAGVQHHFLVMEYVEGQTLRALLDELGRVPEDLCRHIGREIAKGLAAIHAAGVVHRDLKPENVLITKDHAVKVMDLGLARLTGEVDQLSRPRMFVGSVRYAAPEQIERRAADVDHRTDLHALGVLLYELATGRHPYGEEDVAALVRRILSERAEPPSSHAPGISPFFDALVLGLLAKEPARRLDPADLVVRILTQGEESEWWNERVTVVRDDAAPPPRTARTPRETPLHGREEELARLDEAYAAARGGAGRVVLVEGEGGIGKSRLVEEFVLRLEGRGEAVDFLTGGFPPGGAATASGAFSEAYRARFGAAGCARWLAASPVLAPAFDAHLRGDTPPPGAEPLTRESLQTCFVRVTQALSAERVVVILIDDLHFAPEEGRALFASLALGAAGHRVLLVGTARPGFDAAWLADFGRIQHASRIALARLGPKALVRLLVDALRSEHLAAELAARIAEKSDGNPFFVFEILKSLREAGVLTRRDDGTWSGTRVVDAIEVPSSVADLVHARVAGLGEEERNLLDVAACCGFEFEVQVVAAALAMPAIPAMQRFAHLEKKHRIVRSAGRRMAFDHHQVQEALYAALHEPLREAYHAAIAAALEARQDAAGGNAGAGAQDVAGGTGVTRSRAAGALAAELADHYLRGGQGERARPHLVAALDHLQRAYAKDASVRLADLALRVRGAASGRDRVELILRRAGWFAFRASRPEEALRLEEAVRLADEDGDGALRARARHELGSCLRRLSRHAESQEMLRAALTLAREAADVRIEAAVTGDLGAVAIDRDRLKEAKSHLTQQLRLARAAGDKKSESNATGNLGYVALLQGRFAEAERRLERHILLAQRAGDRRGEVVGNGNLGIVLWKLGRLTDAQTHFLRNLELAREIGDRRGEASATGSLGIVAQERGLFAEARELRERHLVLARELGDRPSESISTGNLAELLSTLGRKDEARTMLKDALEIARSAGHAFSEAYWLQALADVAADEGDAREAERLCTEALALRREAGNRSGEAEVLCARGGHRALAGRLDDARQDLETALVVGEELSEPSVRLTAASRLAAIAGPDKATAVERARALAESLGNLVGLPTMLDARYHLWKATGDAAQLREARRILEHLVAHAPEDCRRTIVEQVRMHREISAAASEPGS